MKSFQEFQESLSRNVIRLDKESQKNLNKAKRGQIGPQSRPVPHTQFRLEPTNIPMK